MVFFDIMAPDRLCLAVVCVNISSFLSTVQNNYVASGSIRSQIVGEEGEGADHHTTTTALNSPNFYQKGLHSVWNVRQSASEDLLNLVLDPIFEDSVHTPLHGTPSFCSGGPPGSVVGRSQGATHVHPQQTSFQMSSGPTSSQSTPHQTR